MSLFYKWQPRDVIGLVVIVGGLILVSMHIDGIVGGLLVSVVAFYFGLNTPKPNDHHDGKTK